MKIEKVNEIIGFYKTIGALDELSERQLVDIEEINTEEHKEYLEELLEKFNIPYENVGGGLYDEIQNMEIVINERFTEIMERI